MRVALEGRGARLRKADGLNIVIGDDEGVSVPGSVNCTPSAREITPARGERKDNHFFFVLTVVGEDINGYGVASSVARLDINVDTALRTAVCERNHTVIVARSCRKQEWQIADGRGVGERDIEGR